MSSFPRQAKMYQLLKLPFIYDIYQVIKHTWKHRYIDVAASVIKHALTYSVHVCLTERKGVQEELPYFMASNSIFETVLSCQSALRKGM